MGMVQEKKGLETICPNKYAIKRALASDALQCGLLCPLLDLSPRICSSAFVPGAGV